MEGWILYQYMGQNSQFWQMSSDTICQLDQLFSNSESAMLFLLALFFRKQFLKRSSFLYIEPLRCRNPIYGSSMRKSEHWNSDLESKKGPFNPKNDAFRQSKYVSFCAPHGSSCKCPNSKLISFKRFVKQWNAVYRVCDCIQFQTGKFG